MGTKKTYFVSLECFVGPSDSPFASIRVIRGLMFFWSALIRDIRVTCHAGSLGVGGSVVS